LSGIASIVDLAYEAVARLCQSESLKIEALASNWLIGPALPPSVYHRVLLAWCCGQPKAMGSYVWVFAGNRDKNIGYCQSSWREWSRSWQRAHGSFLLSTVAFAIYTGNLQRGLRASFGGHERSCTEKTVRGKHSMGNIVWGG
jgi:hypothetical protein